MLCVQEIKGLHTNPRHIETIPQAKVRIGSHILGVTFFNTRLLGISLWTTLDNFSQVMGRNKLPQDVRRVEDCQALIVLVVRHAQVVLEVIETSIANIGPVEERTEKQNCQDGKDSVLLLAAGGD